LDLSSIIAFLVVGTTAKCCQKNSIFFPIKFIYGIGAWVLKPNPVGHEICQVGSYFLGGVSLSIMGESCILPII
jgi:hypothetical protein